MATAKKLPSGSWRVLQYIGKDKNGKRIYESYTAETKREAEYLAALGRTKQQNKEREGMTAGEAIERYIDSKDAVLSPKTIREYRTIHRNAFQALLPLTRSQLTPEVIQLAVNEYSKGRAPKTVKNAVALLTSACAMHFPDMRISVTLPQRKQVEVVVPEIEEVRQLLEATEGNELQTAIMLAAFMGMRRSEILPLRWDDIDFERNTIRINKAMVLNQDAIEKLSL